MSLNCITLSPDAQATLQEFMRQRGIQSPDSAVELALRESVAGTKRPQHAFDFRSLIGTAAGDDGSASPRFQDNDDLWERDQA